MAKAKDTTLTLARMASIGKAIRFTRITGHQYATFRQFVEELGAVVPVSATWAIGGYKDRPRPEISKEYTYEKCVDWMFNLETMQVKILMWDGDPMSGTRIYERCTWVFQITDAHTRLIADVFFPVLMHAVRTRATQDEDGAQERARQERISERELGYLAATPLDV